LPAVAADRKNPQLLNGLKSNHRHRPKQKLKNIIINYSDNIQQVIDVKWMLEGMSCPIYYYHSILVKYYTNIIRLSSDNNSFLSLKHL